MKSLRLILFLALFTLPLAAQFTFRNVGLGGVLSRPGLAPPAPPAPPTVTMRNDNNNGNTDGSYLVIEWDAVPTATSYVIYRSTTSGSGFSAIKTNSVTSLNDPVDTGTTVAYCVNYYYKVKALNAGGASDFSNEVTGYTVGPVSDLSATGGANQASLSWSMTSCSIITSVRRSDDPGGPYNEVGTSTDGTFLDTGLDSAHTYYYVVVENGLWGASNYSNEQDATTDP
jgi:fibronectin type 3 domain-containing protein